MDRTEFYKIKTKALSFKYSAFNYIEFDDMKSYNLLVSSDSLILVLGYNQEAKTHEYIWAANNVYEFLKSLKYIDKYIISFIPKDWVSDLNSNGLQIRNAWHDYYLNDLDKKDFTVNSEYDFLKPYEIDIASEITLQCKVKAEVLQDRLLHGLINGSTVPTLKTLLF